MRYYIGLDLGKKHDYSAIAVVEKRTKILDDPRTTEAKWIEQTERKSLTTLDVGYLYRWPLNTKYEEVVKRTAEIVRNPKLMGEVSLIVDGTGVGAAVTEMLAAEGLSFIEIVIHGGKQVTRTGRLYAVPKMDLVSAMAISFEQRLIRLAKTEHRETLVNELQHFRYKITASGNQTAAAWRERDHDDLVLAASMAVWYARRTGVRTGIEPISEEETVKDYDPFADL
ncbi:MAG: hypothetical protein LAT56_00370 [Wenzhouxiangella sp.]|nr:hypothetical protein [Wenzhouxiangella sp.]